MYEITEIHIWDLDDSSSRYDHTVALPSDDTLFTGLTVFAVLAMVVSVFLLIQLLSIITTRSVRSKSFNLYLFFLVVPDFVFSFLCGVTCALNASAGHYVSRFMCEFQTVYTVFGFSGSAWMNAVIARELHTMIRYSHGRRRYFPPSTRKVCLQALVVYLWSAFVASWTLIDWLPHKAVPYHGTACLPAQESNPANALFFWLVFVPAMMVTPFTYVMYVWFDVFYHKLLPVTGRTRMIFLYFLHLVVVYLVMWMPTALFMFVLIKFGFWPSWIAGAWSHMQGFVSVMVSFHKPDIRQAFFGFLLCQADKADAPESSDFFATGWSRAFMRNFRRLGHVTGALAKPSSPSQDEQPKESSLPHEVQETPVRLTHASSASHFSHDPHEHDEDPSPWEADDVHEAPPLSSVRDDVSDEQQVISGTRDDEPVLSQEQP